MASKSPILLLALFLVVVTQVHSHHDDDEKLKIKINYVKDPVSPPPKATPPPVVKPATPPPPPAAKTPYPSPPLQGKAPVPPPSPVKPPVAPAPPVAGPMVKSTKDCVPLCGYRCKEHSRQNVCMRACTTCCQRCKCVPPGTSGNREVCGKCYTEMHTHGDRPKCP